MLCCQNFPFLGQDSCDLYLERWRVASVMKIYPVLPFPPQKWHLVSKVSFLDFFFLQFYLLAVYDDNMVSSIIKRVVDWLVLSLKKLCDHLFGMDARVESHLKFMLHVGHSFNLSGLERILPLCVVDVPCFGEGCPLLHSLKPWHSPLKIGSNLYLDLWSNQN